MGTDLGGFASRIELRMLPVMCDRMEPQSAVYSDYGDWGTFRQIRNFTVYGHVQEHLAVIAYDKLRSTPPTVAVLLKAFVGVRKLKASNQRTDGNNSASVSTRELD